LRKTRSLWEDAGGAWRFRWWRLRRSLRRPRPVS